jgi:hypothetical protein
MHFDFEEAHCRASATLERMYLEVTFERCYFDAQGASQVVTKLESCAMDDSILSAVSGDSSV